MKRMFLSSVILISFTANSQVLKIEKIKSTEEVKETKSQIKKIESDEIKITKQIDIGEILSNLYPEISHVRKGAVANDIIIRGFSRDNINVLLDDEKIYGACPNRMDPPIFHVSTMQVEKVVALEGPFDVENQGSLTAVVNVKTKEPQKGLKIEAGGTVGSFKYRQGYISVYGGNEKIKALVGYQKQYSKPYETGEGKKITEYKHLNPANDYQNSQINRTAFDIDNVWFKTIFNLHKENLIKISLGFDEAKSVLYPYLLMDAVNDRTYRFSTEYQNKYLNLRLKIYYNKTKHDMQDKWRNSAIQWTDGTKSTRGYMMRTYAQSSVKGFKLEKIHKWKIGTFKSGIDGFIRKWNADNTLMMNDNRGFIPDVNVKSIGFFGKFSKKINKNIISLGLRIDNTESKADKNAFGVSNKNLYNQYYGNNYILSKTDTYISGFILGKHYFYKNSYVYAGLGHTVRVPDPQERYVALKRPNMPVNKPDWVGNTYLKPVKNNEIDLGVKYSLKKVKVSVNAFYSKLKDYIYITKITDPNNLGEKAMSYENIDATFYGGDLNIKTLIKDFILFEVGGAYQIGKKNNGTDKDIAEIPPLKLRTSLSYDDLKKYILLEMIYAAKQDKVDSTLNEQPTPSYTVFNFKAGYKTKHIFIGIGVDNIFNKSYYTHLSYLRNPFSAGMKVPESGRFIYLNVSGRL